MAPECDGPYVFHHMPGYALTSPLLFGEPVRPAVRYKAMRDSLNLVIDKFKAGGRVASAGVYVHDLVHSEWTGVNLTEQYDPGSMMKISVLMYWLERAMHEPGLLEREFEFTPTPGLNLPAPRIEGPHVTVGQRYSINDLLRYMIVHSDNHATSMLTRLMDPDRFLDLYQELGLVRPGRGDTRHPMSCQDLSAFLKTLYNATLLDPEHSEIALKLLSETTFKEGLRKGVPKEVSLVHKFGESGTPQDIQLHEVGIAYAGEHPYLIAVMTRGTDLETQEDLIAELSGCAYRGFTKQP
ncbi:MAG: serine hydrolase [Flavobacteriales bacterium]|nr:serine hydrolase [Flavobacteriales bacterium]